MTISMDSVTTVASHPSSTPLPPLVIDVDGTLVRSDLLWEGLLNIAGRHPLQIFRVMRSAVRGRGALKELVASFGAPAVESLPLEPEVLRLIEQARSDGRTVWLISGANEGQVKALVDRVKATDGCGSSSRINLTGVRKLSVIRGMCGEFDYVGNGLADLPLWTAAKHAYAINAAPLTRWLARRRRPDLVILARKPRVWTDWLRALRPHQWTKNLLLLLPAFAAHLPMTSGRVLSALLALLSWSLAASGTYVLNDLLDLGSDRSHLTKRRRPFAAGDIGIVPGIVGFALLWTAAIATAATLSAGFTHVLWLYLVLSIAYSVGLKQHPIVDVLVLAVLYTLRVVAGAVLFQVPLSRWFLAFSVFLFFSLAVLKRVIELRLGSAQGSERAITHAGLIPGRGYRIEDLPVLVGLGAAAGIASSLVYCLYITSTDVTKLYLRPDLLWLGLPILLFVQARIWLLAGRGEMHQDPVVFVLTDRPSIVVAALLLLIVALAA